MANRRNPTTWSGAPSSSDLSAIAGVTRQGYTFQDALGQMGLNHMVGRVQDAVTGRLLSADPRTPDPSNPQDYNRYSYTDNNPLTYTDASGFDADPSVPMGAVEETRMQYFTRPKGGELSILLRTPTDQTGLADRFTTPAEAIREAMVIL